MNLELPAHLNLRAVSGQSPPDWQWRAPQASPQHVRCAKPPFAYAEPIAVAMLGAWAESKRDLGCEPRIDSSLKSLASFQSGLLSAIAGRDDGGEANTGLFFRVREQRDANEHILRALGRLLRLDKEAQEIAAHCLQDLVQNVFDHSGNSAQGAFCSLSFDRRSTRVRLAVADCGRGVPATINDHYAGDLDDAESLRLALEPEFSGGSAGKHNRGVGLYFVRRLALATRGAFCLITQGLTARASPATASSFRPLISTIPQPWQGTAVAVTFKAKGADFGVFEAIKCELDGRGPRYSDLQFFDRSDGAEDWTSVIVGADRGAFAMDRERAAHIAHATALPVLEDGGRLELHFKGVAMATQAFCHALVVPLIEKLGAEVLSRIHFIGCSRKVTSAIRFAANYGSRQLG